jgi:hypothetical protein
MKAPRLWLTVGIIGSLTAGYFIGRARASIPATTPLYYSGFLEDPNGPVSGNKNITVRLYDAVSGGNTVCAPVPAGQTPMQTLVANGRFRVALGSDCNTAVLTKSDTWGRGLGRAGNHPWASLRLHGMDEHHSLRRGQRVVSSIDDRQLAERLLLRRPPTNSLLRLKMLATKKRSLIESEPINVGSTNPSTSGNRCRMLAVKRMDPCFPVIIPSVRKSQ